MITRNQQNIIIELASRYKPKSIGVFGSYARGDNGQNSDLDILIDLSEPYDLLEIIGLEQELSEQLGIKVDLVTLKSLSPVLKEIVEKDLIPLLQ